MSDIGRHGCQLIKYKIHLQDAIFVHWHVPVALSVACLVWLQWA